MLELENGVKDKEMETAVQGFWSLGDITGKGGFWKRVSPFQHSFCFNSLSGGVTQYILRALMQL